MSARSALALLATLPSLALANGGPVGGNGPGPVGGVQPVHNRDVRLVSEDLTLTLDDDGGRYRVVARYVLSNPKAAREVDFGVPLDLVGAGDTEEAPDLAEAGKGVSIELGEASHGCKVVEGTVPPGSRAKTFTLPVTPLGGDAPEPDAPPQGWCVTRLALPQGDAVPLTLRYTADLAYEDWESSKSALTHYSTRLLRYALYPAGYWAGTPERVTIRLETGRFAGLVTATPAPTREQGSVLVWELVRPDLQALGALVATLDATSVLRQAELVGRKNVLHQDGREVLRASASSTLAPQGKATYTAAQAADYDGTTAWCEGKPGDGVGEWLEVRRSEVDKSGKTFEDEGFCHLEGWLVVPGYAKSQAAWEGNGRVRTFRLSPCGKPTEGKLYTLTPGAAPTGKGLLGLARRFDRSAVFVMDEDLDRTCVRLTLVEVEKGKAEDTCISELRPVLNCG